jgi:hypothetical protein
VRTEVHWHAVEGWLEPFVYQGRIQFVEEKDSRGRVKRRKDRKPVTALLRSVSLADRLTAPTRYQILTRCSGFR